MTQLFFTFYSIFILIMVGCGQLNSPSQESLEVSTSSAQSSGNAASVDLGTIGLNQQFTKILYISNRGLVHIKDLAAQFAQNQDRFSFTGAPGINGNCGSELTGGSQCAIEVRFGGSPTKSVYTANLNITYRSGNSSHETFTNLKIKVDQFFLTATYPTPVVAGAANSLRVRLVDSTGNLVPAYTGTVSFSSTDPAAVLPSTYTFVPTDEGEHTFAVILRTVSANQTISVQDVDTSDYQTSVANITVTACTLGSTWSTIDDFQFTSGQNTTPSGPKALVFDEEGNLFQAINAVDTDGASRWLIRKNAKGVASSWDTIDNFRYASGKSTFPKTLAIAPNGNLIAAGNGTDSSNGSNWFTRMSSDGGATWTTVDQVLVTAGLMGQAVMNVYGAIAGSDGTLYVTGSFIPAGAGYPSACVNTRGRYLLRRSTDGGVTWSNAVIWCPANFNTYTLDQYLDSANNFFYATGNLNNGTTRSLGVFTVDLTQNAPWTPTLRSNFKHTAGDNTHGNSIAGAGTGSSRTLIVGGVSDTAGVGGLIRRSIDNGVTWATTDTWGSNSSIAAVYTDENTGKIYAGGYTNTSTWTVKVSSDDGVTWAVSDNFSYQGSLAGAVTAVAKDVSGNLLVMGSGTDSGGKRHAVIRKLACE